MTEKFQVKQFLSVKAVCWVLFILFMLTILFVRFRLLGIPLERDEGDFAYMGQLLLQGIVPYKLAYSMKPPGIYAAYALSMALFGQTPQGIHLGLLIANLASVILLFFISSRLFGPIAGIFSAISYALLSISQSVLGVQAHATHFVVVMVLTGLLFLLKAVETGKIKFAFLSGLFFGLGFLMKQHGIFFLPFGFGYLLWAHFKKDTENRSGSVSSLTAYSVGAALPFAFACIVLFWAGVFDKFWFWTFKYAAAYSSHLPLVEALKLFRDRFATVAGPFLFIWVTALLGLACVLFNARAKKHAFFVLALLALSFLSVCPASIFQYHYFVTVLPIISILAGCCIHTAYAFIRDRQQPRIFQFAPVALFVALSFFALYAQRYYLFEASPKEISRQTYGINPFFQSVDIASYLKEHTFPSDTVAVLGAEPQILFYSQRHSPTAYTWCEFLMEPQPYALQMQQEMIHDIESAQPKYLVFVNVKTSWLVQPDSVGLIFQWSKEYILRHYQRVGLVDILSKEKTDFYWDAAAQNISPHSENYVMVFKRRG